MKRNLELVSAVDSVSIERVLPRTLRIRVTERMTVAQVNVPQTLPAGWRSRFINWTKEGDAAIGPGLSTVPVMQMDTQLPVIQGVDVLQLQPGRRMESPGRLQAALQLIAAFRPFADVRSGGFAAHRCFRAGRGIATTGQGAKLLSAWTIWISNSSLAADLRSGFAPGKTIGRWIWRWRIMCR